MSSDFKSFKDYRWRDTDLLAYKEDGTHFKGVTRQILFDGSTDLSCQLRYFEVAPDGHSTLERHEHTHFVMIIRGAGEVLLGDRVQPVKPFDVITIESQTWHQFRATCGEPLGFLCLVSSERDRPHRPDQKEREQLLNNLSINDFLRF